jgi:hypothetical protein
MVLYRTISAVKRREFCCSFPAGYLIDADLFQHANWDMSGTFLQEAVETMNGSVARTSEHICRNHVIGCTFLLFDQSLSAALSGANVAIPLLTRASDSYIWFDRISY